MQTILQTYKETIFAGIWGNQIIETERFSWLYIISKYPKEFF